MGLLESGTSRRVFLHQGEETIVGVAQQILIVPYNGLFMAMACLVDLSTCDVDAILADIRSKITFAITFAGEETIDFIWVFSHCCIKEAQSSTVVMQRSKETIEHGFICSVDG